MNVEKTVFISYRRTNISWALAVYQYLSKNGYDVFFDFTSIPSGDFEQSILGNIKSRAHFLVLLTPSALERVDEPNDWLRREIETALDTKRNIIPVFFEGFNFGSPSIAKYLTGKLATLSKYNGVDVPANYFEEAMARICTRYLNIPLALVLHPASPKAETAAVEEKKAANKEATIAQKELTAQEWFEKGYKHYEAQEYDETIQAYSEAIRLKPDYAAAYNNRGLARQGRGDIEGAIRDYNEAIRLKPDYAFAFNNRGEAKRLSGDFDVAIKDYNEAIRLKPDYAEAYHNRGVVLKDKGDFDIAIKDYNEAIRLKPDYANAYNRRGNVRKAKGDLDGAIQDYTRSIELKNPELYLPYYNRGIAKKQKGDNRGAIEDYQKYLDLGGGNEYGDQAQVEQTIRDLKKKL